MIDRLRISFKINFFQKLHIEEVLKEIGGYKYIKGDRKKKLFFYNNSVYNFKIELLVKFNNLFIEFNPCRIDSTTINIGTLTMSDINRSIDFIQTIVEETLQLELPDLRSWRCNKIEIRHDYILKNAEEKKLVLDTLGRNDGGHFKRYNTENSSSYLYQENAAFKAYGKKEEIEKHVITKGKSIGILPSGISQVDLDNMIRIEVELKYKKIKKILKSLTNSTIKNVTLGDLLNPYILTSLFDNVLDILNLSMPIRSMDNTLSIIHKKIKSKNMIEKLSIFIKYVNKTCVQVAKRKYKSLFYSYRDRLKSIGVNMLCFIDNVSLTFNIIKEYKFISVNLLRKFINFFSITVPKQSMYNIQELFLIFKTFKFKIRI